MTFKYKDWTLYTREVILKGGTTLDIYFFAKKKPKSGIACDMPDGYRVKEAKTKGSGMPYLTKN
jgi:hypothetical protein